jgi:squalene-associated FAD-dependent desaturase
VQHGASTLTREDAIAVVGAGWAACAAAVALARRGARVHLVEAAPLLGGRARRVDREGLALDNGQHLLLGAYAETLALIETVHGGAAPLVRMPLTVAPLARTQPRAVALRARRLPAPFGLAAGLLAARGLSLRERVATLRWFARLAHRGFECEPTQTVAQLLATLPPRATAALLAPLCIAALNTPVERASATAFAHVLSAAFQDHDAGADFVLPATDLSSLFPEAAARYVVAHGGRVTTSARVTIEAIEEAGVTLSDRERAWVAPGAIVAVGPHQLGSVFARDVALGRPDVAEAIAATAALDYEPIATVYLGYREKIALPRPIVRLDDSPGQWLFDRRDALSRPGRPPASLAQILAVVISASGPHDALDRDALALACDAQLRRLRPQLAPLAWSLAIVERRATYACGPGRARPPHIHVASNVVLAGDYVHATYPATLEAAVQSGLAAAGARAGG